MRLALVIGVVGQLVRWFSAAFAPPLLLALLDGDQQLALHFAITALSTFAVGHVASRGLPKRPTFHRSEALAIVAGTWLTLACLGSMPYAFQGMTWVDSLFESMSGLTATGATVITDFSAFGRGLFLWRAMSQWFGGLGVIALFVVVLPRLGIAGRQLFFAEASGAPSEAISPQVRDGAGRLWMLYTMLTLVLAGSLMLCGFELYEAALHALTTMSAGGFSPNGQSIAGYDNHAVEWVLIPFMFLSGTSFTLLYRVLTGRFARAAVDGELRVYLGVAVVATLVLGAILSGGAPTLDSMRVAAFQLTSLASTTGYASVDFNAWSDSAKGVLILVTVIGGCAGSAAGGPKVVRLLLVLKRAQREITRVLHPRAVLPVRYQKKAVSDDIMRAVNTLVVVYFGGYFLLGIALVILGSDMVTGFSAAVATLGNVGPALGFAGPMGSYAGFNTASKLLMIAAMWIGRLEIVTVLALAHPDVWRYLRWR